MKITGILHASLLTQDLVKARDFYENTLGLEPDSNRPAMSFDGIWYAITANQQIHLLSLPDPEVGLQRPVHGGRDRHIALAVLDVTKLVERLDRAGITYTLSQSGRRALFCRDPDGNALEFIEIN